MTKNKPILVFDFDGVITKRGEALKEEAWDKLFKGADPSIIETFKKWQREYSNGKGDRYDILRETFIESGCPLSLTNFLVDFFANKYDDIVQEMILHEGIATEVRVVLEGLKSLGYRMFINSATPQKAVEDSCSNLQILHCFVAVLGRPGSKFQNFERIAVLYLDPQQKEDFIFIGDSDGDIKAAKEYGCRFIGIANDYNKWHDRTDIEVIPHIGRLLGLL